MTIALFTLAITVGCLAALRWPVVGVLTYMAVYILAPEKQWWGEPLRDLGVRFSFYPALFTAFGLLLHWGQVRAKLPGAFWHSQELLVIGFVAVVGLSRIWGVPIDLTLKDLSGTSETPAEKMPKVAIFVLMMGRTLVGYKEVRSAFFLLILLGGLYIGLDAFTASPSRFVKGRLDALGGTDFRESSAAAAHLSLVAFLIGACFLHMRQWWLKGICLVAGAFTINAIILTQTRAAMLGLLAGGLAAPLLARKGERRRLLCWGVLAVLAMLAITNEQFWSRADTLTVDAEQRDRSAASRFELWSAGFTMWKDHPLGVGAGSFYSVVGEYDPAYVGRDCHNTYIRCMAELGVPGICLFAALIVNAFRTLRRAARLAADTEAEQEIWATCYGLQLGLIAYFVGGIFMGLTYIEGAWWFLCLPVCLERSARNARWDLVTEPLPEQLEPVL